MVNDLKDDFCFKLKGEVKWRLQTDLIYVYFSLLSTEAHPKRFADFLASPFFVSNDKFVLLFKDLFQKYSKPDGKPIRVIDQLQRLFKRKNVDIDGPKLKRMLRDIPGLILEFSAHYQLKNEPAEFGRMKTLAVRNRGYPGIFQSVIKEWQDETEKLKIGRSKLFHLWAAADVAHFSLDVKKDIAGSTSTFSAAEQCLKEFSLALSLFYENEKINRELKYGVSTTINDEKSRNGVLVSIYQQLLKLQISKHYDEATYLKLKLLFLNQVNNLSGADRIIVFLFIQNYLARAQRVYAISKAQEMLWWTNFLLQEELFLDFPSVTKNFVLNRLHSTLKLEDFFLAKKILTMLVPYLPEAEKAGTLQHAKISMIFFKHDYERVLKLVSLEHGEMWKDNLMDEIRLKSYRLRAALCIFTEDENRVDDLDLALDDFSTFLKRQEGAIEADLTSYLQQFLLFCRKAKQAIRKKERGEGAEEMLAILKGEEPILASDWLYDFYSQLRKGDGSIRPSALRGAQQRLGLAH